MAAALSYLNYLVNQPGAGKMLAVCASTGDTSAAAALYSAYLGGQVDLRGAPAPRQGHPAATGPAPGQRRPGLGDPRGLRRLHEGGGDPGRQLPGGPAQLQKRLAHPGARNPMPSRSPSGSTTTWPARCVLVPIGNAGNITAIMAGFLKLVRSGRSSRPCRRSWGSSPDHADPVFRYYLEPDPEKRQSSSR